MERTWLKNYPDGVAPHVNANEYASLVELLDNSFTKYADLPAYKFMGKDYSYPADRRDVARVRRLRCRRWAWRRATASRS